MVNHPETYQTTSTRRRAKRFQEREEFLKLTPDPWKSTGLENSLNKSSLKTRFLISAFWRQKILLPHLRDSISMYYLNQALVSNTTLLCLVSSSSQAFNTCTLYRWEMIKSLVSILLLITTNIFHPTICTLRLLPPVFPYHMGTPIMPIISEERSLSQHTQVCH